MPIVSEKKRNILPGGAPCHLGRTGGTMARALDLLEVGFGRGKISVTAEELRTSRKAARSTKSALLMLLLDTNFLVGLHTELRRGDDADGPAKHFMRANKTLPMAITPAIAIEYAAGIRNREKRADFYDD